jgi:hypothetical protein
MLFNSPLADGLLDLFCGPGLEFEAGLLNALRDELDALVSKVGLTGVR